NPISINRKMTTWGFLGGVDMTNRVGNGLWMLGILTGYMSSDVKFTSSAVGVPNSSNPSSSSIVNARISGPSVGAYANFATGPWTGDLTVKADLLTIKQSFRDVFSDPAATSDIQVDSGSASVDVTNITVGGNVNYRIPLSATHWWEPTGGF